MALTIARVADGEDVWGRSYVRFKDITLDNSYPATGYLINAQDVGLKGIFEAVVVGENAAAMGVLLGVDQTNYLGGTTPGLPSKSVRLRAFFPTGGGDTVPSTLATPGIAAGAVAVTSTAANGAVDLTPGVAVEVATGTDLSTVKVRVRFVGR